LHVGVRRVFDLLNWGVFNLLLVFIVKRACCELGWIRAAKTCLIILWRLVSFLVNWHLCIFLVRLVFVLPKGIFEWLSGPV
jgi:hypothetical protein